MEARDAGGARKEREARSAGGVPQQRAAARAGRSTSPAHPTAPMRRLRPPCARECWSHGHHLRGPRLAGSCHVSRWRGGPRLLPPSWLVFAPAPAVEPSMRNPSCSSGVLAAAAAASSGLVVIRAPDTVTPAPEAPARQVPATQGEVKSVVAGEVLETIDVAGYTTCVCVRQWVRRRRFLAPRWPREPGSDRGRLLMQQFRATAWTAPRADLALHPAEQRPGRARMVRATPPAATSGALAVGKVGSDRGRCT